MSLEIAVQNLLVVKVVDCERDLSEPVEYLPLSEVLALLLHLLDARVHVSEFAVDHDNAEIALFIGEGVFIGDDVDVPQFLQNFELILDIFSFFFIDFKDLDSLECIVVVLISDVLAQEHISR